MEKNVGKHMMEIAKSYEISFKIISSIMAVLTVIIGIVVAVEQGKIFYFLIGLVLGALEILTGFNFAEIKTMQLRGFGTIIDRIEHLKPECFEEDSPKVHSRQMSEKNSNL